MITDEERAGFLSRNGYLPLREYTMSPTELVDWAIKNAHCPAYWREPRKGEQVKFPPQGNGLIFVKRGDRDRIDECIEREQGSQSTRSEVLYRE